MLLCLFQERLRVYYSLDLLKQIEQSRQHSGLLGGLTSLKADSRRKALTSLLHLCGKVLDLSCPWLYPLYLSFLLFPVLSFSWPCSALFMSFSLLCLWPCPVMSLSLSYLVPDLALSFLVHIIAASCRCSCPDFNYRNTLISGTLLPAQSSSAFIMWTSLCLIIMFSTCMKLWLRLHWLKIFNVMKICN